MLIRELVYDTEADELDILTDTFKPEPAEVIPIGNDFFGGGQLKMARLLA